MVLGRLASAAALRRVRAGTLEDDQTSKLKMAKAERRLVQAVLAQHSELVGHTAKDARVRTRYDAVIIAVHRAGERVHEQIGAIRFRPGDVLLLDTGPSFMRSHGKDPAFALVSEIRNSMPPRFHLLYVASAAAITMIALAVANVLPLFSSALLAAGFMIITGCLTQQQARDSVNWQVIVTIASAFGLSNALENSGVAGNLAKWLVDAADATGTGETGLLVAIYVGTIVLANIVGNNAAAASCFPSRQTPPPMPALTFLHILQFCFRLCSFASPSAIRPTSWCTLAAIDFGTLSLWGQCSCGSWWWHRCHRAGHAVRLYRLGRGGGLCWHRLWASVAGAAVDAHLLAWWRCAARANRAPASLAHLRLVLLRRK